MKKALIALALVITATTASADTDMWINKTTKALGFKSAHVHFDNKMVVNVTWGKKNPMVIRVTSNVIGLTPSPTLMNNQVRAVEFVTGCKIVNKHWQSQILHAQTDCNLQKW